MIKPDAIKIDRSHVAPLAHMVAIRMLDCDILQGYVLQRPMAKLDFVADIDRRGLAANY